MEVYPETLPHPTVRYSYQKESNVVSTRMDSGRYRQRKRFKGRRKSADLSFIFTHRELGIFEMWFENLIDSGASTFTMFLPDPSTQSSQPLECQVLRGQYNVNAAAGELKWRVSMRVIASSYPVLSLEEYADLLNGQENVDPVVLADWIRTDEAWQPSDPGPESLFAFSNDETFALLYNAANNELTRYDFGTAGQIATLGPNSTSTWTFPFIPSTLLFHSISMTADNKVILAGDDRIVRVYRFNNINDLTQGLTLENTIDFEPIVGYTILRVYSANVSKDGIFFNLSTTETSSTLDVFRFRLTSANDISTTTDQKLGQVPFSSGFPPLSSTQISKNRVAVIESRSAAVNEISVLDFSGDTVTLDQEILNTLQADAASGTGPPAVFSPTFTGSLQYIRSVDRLFYGHSINDSNTENQIFSIRNLAS